MKEFSDRELELIEDSKHIPEFKHMIITEVLENPGEKITIQIENVVKAFQDKHNYHLASGHWYDVCSYAAKELIEKNALKSYDIGSPYVVTVLGAGLYRKGLL